MFSLRLLRSFVTAWALVTAAQAHEVERTASAPFGLDAEASPLAARYAVTVDRPSLGKFKDKPTLHTWYFYRDAQRVALLKGSVDEVWYRDAQQRISFERVFHDDARVVDYSTGELTTLHVKVNWAALATFVDLSELAQLKLVSKHGKGRDARWHLVGWIGPERVTVDWRPALQLPQRLTRQIKGGSTVAMALIESSPTPLPNWPVAGLKSANYLHLDAADFGDMDYDPVVRKSEALDTRLGWRASHKHD